jgi:hypothetical protein
VQEPPDVRKGASAKGTLGNNRIAVVEQNYPTEFVETFQQKKIAKRFGFAPATASVVAALAFASGCSR